MSDRVCVYCGVTHGFGEGQKELRPYGPGGAWTCYPCMKASPERTHEAEYQFGGAFKKTGKVMLTDDGPTPFIGGN